MSKALKLTKTLFWDIDLKQIDWQKHHDFVIGRVLLYGDENDFVKIKKMYGLPAIKKAVIKTKNFDKKSLNFWSVIFNIPKNKFLCFQTRSRTKQNPFWNR